jgi:hypothetical protein
MTNSVPYLETIMSVTVFNSRNYFLGDYYLVVRNDSSSTGAGTKM